MIMPGSLPLSAPPVRDELTRYLSDGWNGVVDTDIDGENSEPYRIDNKNPRFGQVHASRRVARTVFLGSAPSSRDQKLRGIEDIRVRLGTVQPKEHIAVFNDALGGLRDRLSHLYESNHRYWFDLPPNLTRTVEDRAANLKPDEVEGEIERRLRKVKERADFCGVHVCATPGNVPDEQEVRLVVLPPDQSHRGGRKDTAAMQAAADILDKKSTGPRSNKNMLVFVAPDANDTTALQEEVRKYLAWKSVVEDAEVLNLDSHQRRQATDAEARTDRTVDGKLNEAYSWLLVPTQEGTNPIQWEATRISGSEDSYVRKAAKKVKGAEQLITKWSPELLRLELNNWLWKDAPHIELKRLWELLCTYIYLPRLKDDGVLLEAIREGVRAKDYFAYASSVDEHGKYLGLQFGAASGSIQMHATSVLVKPEVARKQVEESQAATEAERKRQKQKEEDGGQGTGGRKDKERQDDEKPVYRRFHGTVHLSATRLSRDAGRIAEEVVQHLAGLVGAEVDVSLEIQVRLPDAVPDNVLRTVTENCRTLKFDSHSFEEE
jgi:predicted AAA+ superfamily ATPase